MSETPQFNELEELHKDLEALEEDLEDLKTKLTYLGSHQKPVLDIFEHEAEPAKFIRHRVLLNRAIEEELKLKQVIEDKAKLKNPHLIDEDLNKWHHDKDLIDPMAEDVTSMRTKESLEREMQTLKGQISDKEKEIEDKKEEIKVEKSMTPRQIEERGKKSYRL
ncbi:unnamed protein product [Clonostachys rosea f. rosea IK726]|jgi:hypothetical protein|uniref:Uncharacterized protein n=1 Tax=Clonostachys rosea f. rosea IK726 TaxID=1349383 RepID=A0ACA9TFW0_BIOOC|nr:unnamed protein product [Clonostachys rosea f. rosea IK726]